MTQSHRTGIPGSWGNVLCVTAPTTPDFHFSFHLYYYARVSFQKWCYMSNRSIILRSVGQLTRYTQIYTVYTETPSPFSLTRGTIVVIWWSSQLQLALPVGSNLHSCVCCPHSEPSERRSVLVPWPGCYHRIFFYPPEGQDCHTAPSLFSLFFLHLCRSLRVMQMHSPSTPPLF